MADVDELRLGLAIDNQQGRQESAVSKHEAIADKEERKKDQESQCRCCGRAFKVDIGKAASCSFCQFPTPEVLLRAEQRAEKGAEFSVDCIFGEGSLPLIPATLRIMQKNCLVYMRDLLSEKGSERTRLGTLAVETQLKRIYKARQEWLKKSEERYQTIEDVELGVRFDWSKFCVLGHPEQTASYEGGIPAPVHPPQLPLGSVPPAHHHHHHHYQEEREEEEQQQQQHHHHQQGQQEGGGGGESVVPSKRKGESLRGGAGPITTPLSSWEPLSVEHQEISYGGSSKRLHFDHPQENQVVPQEDNHHHHYDDDPEPRHQMSDEAYSLFVMNIDLIPADLSRKTVYQLKELLREFGLRRSGKKQAIIERLVQHIVNARLASGMVSTVPPHQSEMHQGGAMHELIGQAGNNHRHVMVDEHGGPMVVQSLHDKSVMMPAMGITGVNMQGADHLGPLHPMPFTSQLVPGRPVDHLPLHVPSLPAGSGLHLRVPETAHSQRTQKALYAGVSDPVERLITILFPPVLSPEDLVRGGEELTPSLPRSRLTDNFRAFYVEHRWETNHLTNHNVCFLAKQSFTISFVHHDELFNYPTGRLVFECEPTCPLCHHHAECWDLDIRAVTTNALLGWITSYFDVLKFLEMKNSFKHSHWDWGHSMVRICKQGHITVQKVEENDNPPAEEEDLFWQ